MQDFEQLKQAKEKCLNDLVGALPLYRERLDSIDPLYQGEEITMLLMPMLVNE